MDDPWLHKICVVIVYIGTTCSATLFSRYKSHFRLNRWKHKCGGYSTTTVQYALKEGYIKWLNCVSVSTQDAKENWTNMISKFRWYKKTCWLNLKTKKEKTYVTSFQVVSIQRHTKWCTNMEYSDSSLYSELQNTSFKHF